MLITNRSLFNNDFSLVIIVNRMGLEQGPHQQRQVNTRSARPTVLP